MFDFFLLLLRYAAIVRPMLYSNLVTGARSSAMVASAWAFAVAAAVAPLMGAAGFRYAPPGRGCSVSWADSPGFSLTYLSVACWAPTAVMAYCYAVILKVPWWGAGRGGGGSGGVGRGEGEGRGGGSNGWRII